MSPEFFQQLFPLYRIPHPHAQKVINIVYTIMDEKTTDHDRFALAAEYNTLIRLCADVTFHVQRTEGRLVVSYEEPNNILSNKGKSI